MMMTVKGKHRLRGPVLAALAVGLACGGAPKSERKKQPARPVAKVSAVVPESGPTAIPRPSTEGLPDANFQVGDRFPPLILPDLDGQHRSIAEFGGKKVILHIFGSW